jgi:hypothetical protein
LARAIGRAGLRPGGERLGRSPKGSRPAPQKEQNTNTVQIGIQPREKPNATFRRGKTRQKAKKFLAFPKVLD